MSILHRYVIREILKFFGVVILAVVAIYLTVDFLEKVDDFLEKGLPLSRMFLYFLYKIPLIIAQILPVGLLLSVLICFGLMRKHNEIVALRGAGVSTGYLIKPVVWIGIGFSLALFLLSEGIVPATADVADRIWLGEVRNIPQVSSAKQDIWIKAPHRILHVRYYDPVRKTLHGITVHQFDDDFRLIRRIDAEKAVFQNGKWDFQQVLEQVAGASPGNFQTQFRDHLELDFPIDFQDLQHVAKKSEEMGYWELSEYVRKVESEGYNAAKFQVDLQSKLAFPAVCLIMGLVGLGIGIHPRTKEGLAASVAAGIGIAFLYWIFYSFCLSLGYGEMLPPIAAAWSANLVFSCVAGLILLTAEQA